MSNKSVFDLDERVAALLSYVFGFISGFFFLIAEKENKFVRFNAMQSILFSIFYIITNWIVNILLGWIWIIGGIIGILYGIGLFAIWVYMMYMAYKGVVFKLPLIGDIVWEKINN